MSTATPARRRAHLTIADVCADLGVARSTLVTAQRDRVVASYAVLSAVGKLSSRTLKLKAENYDARQHYEQVKDLWWGTQTPDGR